MKRTSRALMGLRSLLGSLLSVALFTLLLAAKLDDGGIGDPTGLVRGLVSEYPELASPDALTVAELGQLEFDSRVALIRGGQSGADQLHHEIRLRTLEDLARGQDCRSFLEPGQHYALGQWRDARIATFGTGPFDPRTQARVDFVQDLVPEHLDPTSKMKAVLPEQRFLALSRADALRPDLVEATARRLPVESEAEFRAIALSQRLSNDGPRFPDGAGSPVLPPDQPRLPPPAARELPAVAEVARAADPELAVRSLVPKLFEQTLDPEPEAAARAQVQLEELGRPFVAEGAPGIDCEKAILARLPGGDLGRLDAALARRQRAVERSATEMILPEVPPLERRHDALLIRRTMIAALLQQEGRRPVQPPTAADGALLARVRTELSADILLLDLDGMVDEAGFRRALTFMSDQELAKWEGRLDQEIGRVARLRKLRADLGETELLELQKRRDWVQEARKGGASMDYERYQADLVESVGQAETVPGRVRDLAEVRLYRVDADLRPEVRRRAVLWLGENKFWTDPPPTTDPITDPPIDPTKGGPNKLASIKNLGNERPKGVRLEGTVVIPENLDIMGAGVDPETGALYVATSDRRDPLPLGSGTFDDDEMAKQLLLGVYRSVYVDGYQQLYLSIDPHDLDVDYEHNRTLHGKLTHHDDPVCDDDDHCHNAVRTAGNIADTQVGMTLYDADVFFKRLMLGLDPRTGRPESLRGEGYITPFEEWDRVVRRHRRGEIASRELAAAERLQFKEHLSDSHRACRVWFDMADLELLVDERGNMIFGASPVFAHSEPMRRVRNEMVPAPGGRWCPDTDRATAFVNENWDLLRDRYPELAQLDYVAHLVAFFTWARDLPEIGIFPDFDALDAALEREELASVRTPRWTSGIAREMQSVPDVEESAEDTLYWRATENDGIAVAIVGAAAKAWWHDLGERYQRSSRCGPTLSTTETFGLARCAERLGMGLDELLQRATAEGWRVQEVVDREQSGGCVSEGSFQSIPSRAEAIDGPLECIELGSGVLSTAERGRVMFVHGGVQVGGVRPKRENTLTKPLIDVWNGDQFHRVGFVGQARTDAAAGGPSQRGSWTVDPGSRILARELRSPAGRPVMRWQATPSSIAFVRGPAGSVVLASGDRAVSEWWVQGKRGCTDLVTQTTGGEPTVVPCRSRRGRRRLARDWDQPPADLSPPRVADRWFIAEPSPVEPGPAWSTPEEWQRASALSLQQSRWDDAAVQARAAWNVLLEDETDGLSLLRRLMAGVDVLQPRRIAAVAVVETLLASGRREQAAAELENDLGWALDSVTADLYAWEAGTRAELPERPPECDDVADARGPVAEACARIEAHRSRHGVGSIDDATAMCLHAPMRSRCEELVRVTAQPERVPECRDVTDGRARWRCAASRLDGFPDAWDPALVAADVFAAAGPTWAARLQASPAAGL